MSDTYSTYEPGLIGDMRRAADTLETVSRLFGVHNPVYGEWSAAALRFEADILARPIPGEGA